MLVQLHSVSNAPLACTVTLMVSPLASSVLLVPMQPKPGQSIATNAPLERLVQRKESLSVMTVALGIIVLVAVMFARSVLGVRMDPKRAWLHALNVLQVRLKELKVGLCAIHVLQVHTLML